MASEQCGGLEAVTKRPCLERVVAQYGGEVGFCAEHVLTAVMFQLALGKDVTLTFLRPTASGDAEKET